MTSDWHMFLVSIMSEFSSRYTCWASASDWCQGHIILVANIDTIPSPPPWHQATVMVDSLWGEDVLRFSVPLLYAKSAWDLGVHLVTSPRCQGTLLSHLLSNLLLNAFRITWPYSHVIYHTLWLKVPPYVACDHETRLPMKSGLLYCLVACIPK